MLAEISPIRAPSRSPHSPNTAMVPLAPLCQRRKLYHRRRASHALPPPLILPPPSFALPPPERGREGWGYWPLAQRASRTTTSAAIFRPACASLTAAGPPPILPLSGGGRVSARTRRTNHLVDCCPFASPASFALPPPERGRVGWGSCPLAQVSVKTKIIAEP